MTLGYQKLCSLTIIAVTRSRDTRLLTHKRDDDGDARSNGIASFWMSPAEKRGDGRGKGGDGSCVSPGDPPFLCDGGEAPPDGGASVSVFVSCTWCPRSTLGEGVCAKTRKGRTD